MNTIALKIIHHPGTVGTRQSGEPPSVTLEIWIDGTPLDEPHVVDLRELVRSLFAPGEFNFFTCGCGVPGCAGIWEGFQVRHLPGRLRWRFRRPVSDRNDEIQHLDARWEMCKRSATTVEYEFDREQFPAALDRGLAEALAAPAGARFAPHGTDREMLESLSTQHHPVQCEEVPGRRHLYFLADDSSPWFLERQFVSLADLSLSPHFIDGFGKWQSFSETVRTNPRLRPSWLESTRNMLLRAYRSGLPADIDIKLVARRWTAREELDPWDVDIRDVGRELQDQSTPFADPYICLSADTHGFCIWADLTPEPKDSRYRFFASGSQVTGALLVPFELEMALREWAAGMPGAQPPFSIGGELLWAKHDDHEQVGSEADWEAFNARGLQLAARLKATIGKRATVMYEIPFEAPRGEGPRRIEIEA